MIIQLLLKSGTHHESERVLTIFGFGKEGLDNHRWLTLGPMTIDWQKDHWWVRICRRIVWFRDYNRYGLTFSQRNGITKFWRVGRWIVSTQHMPRTPSWS